MNKKNSEKDKKLTIDDMLCSTGYLPPRSEEDMERFDQIYDGETFETEKYNIDADALFNRVLNDFQKKQVVKNVLTMTHENNSYLVASIINNTSYDSVKETISRFIEDKKK